MRAFRESVVGVNRPRVRGSYAFGGVSARVGTGGPVIAVKVVVDAARQQAGWYREASLVPHGMWLFYLHFDDTRTGGDVTWKFYKN